MKKPAEYRLGAAGMLICLAALFHPAAGAERVYKCVEGGKTRFTSNPDEGQGCQSMELNVPQPNPVDAARQREQNREYARQEKSRADQRREENRIDPEAQRRTLNAKLAEAVARAPVPKLPNSGGKGRGKGKGDYR